MHIEPLLKLSLELCKSVSSIIDGVLVAVYVGIRRCECCTSCIRLASGNNPVVHLLEASDIRAAIRITSFKIVAPTVGDSSEEVARIRGVVLELPTLSVRAGEAEYVFSTLVVVEIILQNLLLL